MQKTRKFTLINKILVFCVFLITSLLCSALLFNSNITKAESIDSDLEVKVDEVLALSLVNCDLTNSSIIQLNVLPNKTGVFKSNCQTATVNTNAPGYSLSVYHRNSLPPDVSSETLPIINPSGYNDFATDDDVNDFSNDLYNNLVTLPVGANCWLGFWPGEALQDMKGRGCDDGSDTWDYCITVDTQNGVCAIDVDGEWLEGPAPDYEWYYEVYSYGEIMCYAQPTTPGWCTPNQDGTYTKTILIYSNELVYQNPTTIDPLPTIASTTSPMSSPNTIVNNTWGFAVEGLSLFDTTYTIDNASNNYAELPTENTTIYQISGWPLPQAPIKFYYGTNVSTATVAGTYATTITYTAIGEPVVEPPCKYNCVYFTIFGDFNPAEYEILATYPLVDGQIFRMPNPNDIGYTNFAGEYCSAWVDVALGVYSSNFFMDCYQPRQSTRAVELPFEKPSWFDECYEYFWFERSGNTACDQHQSEFSVWQNDWQLWWGWWSEANEEYYEPLFINSVLIGQYEGG